MLVQSMVTQQHPDDVEPAQQAFADSAAQVRLGTTDVVPDAAGMHFEIEIPATIRDGGAFLIAEQISVVSQVSYAWQSLLAPTGANSSPTVTPAAGWIKKAADSADDADS
ncbi:MAG TPA: hypothetical protein VI248_17695 [Kineosporiaceae bacterium]